LAFQEFDGLVVVGRELGLTPALLAFSRADVDAEDTFEEQLAG